MNAPSPFRWKPLLLLGLFATPLLGLAAVTSLTHARPQGGQVTAGQAPIFQFSPAILVNQPTDNWRSFSIDVKELVRFVQPGASSVALNRALGENPSVILGQPTDPDGIVFDPNAEDGDVEGPLLLASTTLDISDAGFLTGRYVFRRLPGSFASIINQGTIVTAPGGFLALSALGKGPITAYLGTIYLSTGEQLTLDFSGDGLLRFVVDRAVVEQSLGPVGQPPGSWAGSAGRISAKREEVTLTAKAVNDLLGQMVNSSGIIKAYSLVNPGTALTQATEQGAAGLGGQVEGTIANTGTIDVAATEPGAAPGRVLLVGERGKLAGAINAWGASLAQGGNVTVTSTEGSVILRGSVINATILARGGDRGGDGGFVEVSGKDTLSFAGSVDAGAPFGKVGTLLLDPLNIIVATGGTATLAQVSSASTDPNTDRTIDPGAINAAVANVVLAATNNTTVNNSTGAVNPGITLAMRAGRHITLNADVSTNNALSLIAGGSITGSGVLSASAATLSTGGTAGTSSVPASVRGSDQVYADASGTSKMVSIKGLVSFNGPGVNDPLSNNPKDSALSNMAKLTLPNDRSAFPTYSARTQMALNPTGFLLPPPLFRVEDGRPSTPPLNVAKGETDPLMAAARTGSPTTVASATRTGAGAEGLISGVRGLQITDTAAPKESTGGADPLMAAARTGSPTTAASNTQPVAESGIVSLTTPSRETGAGALVIAANTTAGAESLSQNVANPLAPGASGGQIDINTAAGPIMVAARTGDSTGTQAAAIEPETPAVPQSAPVAPVVVSQERAIARLTPVQPSSGEQLTVLGNGLTRFAVPASQVAGEGRVVVASVRTANDLRTKVVNTSGVTRATSLWSSGGVIQLVGSPAPAAPSRSY